MHTLIEPLRYIFFLVISVVLICCGGGSSGDTENGTGQSSQGGPVGLSNNAQLFLDNYLVANIDNLTRELQRPTKHPSNPIITQDQAWEDILVEMYGTVLYNSTLDNYQAWYRASSSTIVNPEYYICYAESPDGISWTKPDVGALDFGPHSRHNVVIRGGHGICVLKTPLETDPNRLYKAGGGDLLGFSPNGIDWTLSNWNAVAPNDTSTSIIQWNNRYFAYVRSQGVWQNGVMRQIGMSTSADFTQWNDKTLMFVTDASDGYPWTQPYALSVTAYGDQLIGLLWLLHLDQTPGNNKVGNMDVQLLVSRDGSNWNRVANRAVFLEPTANTWDQGRVCPSTTMLVKDNQINIYYLGTTTRHGLGYIAPVSIGLATLPLHRFVALKPVVAGQTGSMETVPCHFTGTRLTVNAEINLGDLEVELLNDAGEIIPGFIGSNSVLTAIDALSYQVQWDINGTLVDLSSIPQPVVFKFSLNNGELYAFQID